MAVQNTGPVVAILLMVPVFIYLIRERKPLHLAFVVGLAIPAFLFGLFYAVQEADQGVLGSYRSFKITSTFLAFTLISFGLWFGSRP